MITFSARFYQKGKSSETSVGCVYSGHDIMYLQNDCHKGNYTLKFCRMGLIYVGRVGSTAVTVSLSIERYLAISQRDSDVSDKFLFWTPIIFSVLYNIPKFFELEKCEISQQSSIQYHLNATQFNPTYVPKNNNSCHEMSKDNSIKILHPNLTHEIENITIKDYADDETQIVSRCDNDGMRTTALRQNKIYIIFYVVISKVILVEIIPWIMVITLNFLTWRKMKMFQKNRKAMLNRKNQGNKSKYPICRIQSII